MTTYLMVKNDDGDSTVTVTKASGFERHKISVGALNGQTILGYSGSVNGTTTFYQVDGGPNVGHGISAT